MIKNNKYAWTWQIKEKYLEEYVKMHMEPWPEIMREHEIAGFRNYSIFQNGTQFIYVFECDDVKRAFDYLDKSEDCKRWNAITSQMVQGSFDFSESEPIKYLDQVFYLK